MRRATWPTTGLLLAGVLAGCASTQESSGQPVAESRWSAPTNVAERAALAGLDMGPMGMAEHYHPHLIVMIDGEAVPIPPNIGVDPVSGAMSAVHTHEADGLIHIEASTVGERFTLGQLFTQWGVTLTPTQIGEISAVAGESVEVTSNGGSVEGDPNDLRLEPDQRIVVRLRSIAGS
ncbi:hypothetical protein [Aeromicrobium sp. A1-2]|uniref:hypothetical protein n=1 Tax=Aeromicrobium sp. A1-2 TaxID=2107713 RepID=UPI001C1F428D|nr:hypothetical protein [Aeromicrobium sp. A1-2]